jgi:CubicO group peptidase (beta-lactamase class C family)
VRRSALAALVVVTASAAPGVSRPAVASPEERPREERREDLSPRLREVRERFDVPALAAALVRGDRVTALGCDGVRRRGSPERVTPADRFHLGSCTKAMTAALVARFVEEGRLRWAQEVVPSLPFVEDAHAGWKGATLERLLWHRAGVPSDLSKDGLWARLWRREGSEVEQRRTLAKGVLGKAPARAPGSAYEYANAGYALAGAMLEEATGRPWEDLLRERVFVPLGIETGGFGAPGTPDAVDAPRGHRADGTPVEPGPGADNPPAIGPGGTAHMTVEDWARFVAEFVVRPGKGRLGLSAKTVERLTTPPDGADYAMGWVVARRPWGGRVLTHAGSNTMWFCVAWVAPEKGFAVLVACNQGGPAAERACDAAASLLVADAAR